MNSGVAARGQASRRSVQGRRSRTDHRLRRLSGYLPRLSEGVLCAVDEGWLPSPLR